MCVFTLPKASIDLVLIGVSTHMHQLELAHIGSSRAVTLPSVVYPNGTQTKRGAAHMSLFAGDTVRA